VTMKGCRRARRIGEEQKRNMVRIQPGGRERDKRPERMLADKAQESFRITFLKV
jgi:SLT domain-containing protein